MGALEKRIMLPYTVHILTHSQKIAQFDANAILL